MQLGPVPSPQCGAWVVMRLDKQTDGALKGGEGLKGGQNLNNQVGRS